MSSSPQRNRRLNRTVLMLEKVQANNTSSGCTSFFSLSLSHSSPTRPFRECHMRYFLCTSCALAPPRCKNNFHLLRTVLPWQRTAVICTDAFGSASVVRLREDFALFLSYPGERPLNTRSDQCRCRGRRRRWPFFWHPYPLPNFSISNNNKEDPSLTVYCRRSIHHVHTWCTPS